MDVTDEIRAMLSTHRFLLVQLYKHQFIQHPEARRNFPQASLALNAAQLQSASDSGDHHLAEMHQLMQDQLESFFRSVEERVEIAVQAAKN